MVVFILTNNNNIFAIFKISKDTKFRSVSVVLPDLEITIKGVFCLLFLV